ncbi:uncharacterized protein LOC141632678 [Silene latifolia]|uniref:uncharacterized protein LOC141632678 n=1 Tax=Silene latifolia TaxID=37657 RepID=UPI003D7858DD
MKIASWNVRGLNCPLKQNDVRDFLNQNHLDVVALLETRVKIGNASRILNNSFRHWDSICNYGHHYNRRIWLLYNPINVTLSVQSIGDQWISCSVFHKVSSTSLNLTVVYGSNDAAERNALWAGMEAASTPNPWLVIGNFNVVRCPAEKLGPHPPILNEMMDFNSCLISCNLDDIAGTGADMTWTNKQDPLTRVWSKLDRALVNQQWISSFPTSNALFMESGLSDHSLVVVQVQEDIKTQKRFSFLNSWIRHPNYDTIVREAWSFPVAGNPMFRLFTKLKKVKHALNRFRRENFSDLTCRVNASKLQLKDCQKELLQDPFSPLFIEAERYCLANYTTLKKAELDMLTQRAKLTHIQSSDTSSNYFFAKIAEREHQQNIVNIVDHNGLLHQGVDNVSLAFQNYYNQLLGQTAHVHNLDDNFIGQGPCVSEDDKSSWDIIKGDICAVDHGFFRTISCCTVFYKTVSKILSNRIQPILPYLIGEEQAAFVKGRNIFENIILSQSLIKGYARKVLSPRCLIKVDIKKAFDSIQREFLSQMLSSLGFPSILSKWIMSCITNTWYSFKLNGGIAGFFPGKSGIRQGDPLSAYLFVLSMEILSRYLRMIFVRGDVPSVVAVKDTLVEFALLSGLHANVDKTNIYLGGISPELVSEILQETSFSKGQFPFKYLGIPLSTSRISVTMFDPLITKIQKKVLHWSSHSSSYAGKLQLINSVVFGLDNYWGASILLPIAIIKKN